MYLTIKMLTSVKIDYDTNKSILSFYILFASPNRLKFFQPQGLHTYIITLKIFAGFWDVCPQPVAHSVGGPPWLLDLIKSFFLWFSTSSLFMLYRTLSLINLFLSICKDFLYHVFKLRDRRNYICSIHCSTCNIWSRTCHITKIW